MQNLTQAQSIAEALAPTAQKLGFILMSIAATAGLFELTDHSASKALVPAQAVFASNSQSSESANPLRREKEESAPHYISYSAAQRTPGRTGRY